MVGNHTVSFCSPMPTTRFSSKASDLTRVLSKLKDCHLPVFCRVLLSTAAGYTVVIGSNASFARLDSCVASICIMSIVESVDGVPDGEQA